MDHGSLGWVPFDGYPTEHKPRMRRTYSLAAPSLAGIARL